MLPWGLINCWGEKLEACRAGTSLLAEGASGFREQKKSFSMKTWPAFGASLWSQRSWKRSRTSEGGRAVDSLGFGAGRFCIPPFPAAPGGAVPHAPAEGDFWDVGNSRINLLD